MAVIEAVAQRAGSKSQILVREFYEKHAENLNLELLAGNEGFGRPILASEVERPGLSLAGHVKGSSQRILVFGQAEMRFLKNLDSTRRLSHLKNIFFSTTPFVVFSRKLRPTAEILHACEEKTIPLFVSSLSSMELMALLFKILSEECSAHLSCHGSLVEIFGMGVMIQGDAAVGKSEAALGLIQRGHRLISDDIVKIRKICPNKVEGFGVDISRHHMEIKGLGIINVARLYGVASICEKKNLDIVVKLEVWNDSQFYDHLGLNENRISLLGVELPYHLIHVKSGRDVVLLLETIALTHRLKRLSEGEQKGRMWSN